MDVPNTGFTLAGTLEEVKAKGRIVVHGAHRPILVVYDRGRVFALDNRCPHMGFPLDRGSVEDGILTCHWHHACFDLESGCTFDLWADDTPTFPVEVRDGEVWVKTTFRYADPATHWRQRLNDGLAHDIGLVIAKAVQGQLAAGVPKADVVRQVALFGAHNRDGWGVGLTILTALANLLPSLSEDEAYLAIFHGARRVAADCDGQPPRRERAPLESRPEPATLERWLRRWTKVRHREAAERTLLTAIAEGLSPAALANALLAAETERAFADDGHSLDFINKAFECLDLIGWGHASSLLPTIVGQMAAARAPRKRPNGDSLSILSRFVTKRLADWQRCSRKAVARVAGRIMRRLLGSCREDAGFHAFQILEAEVRQFAVWGDTDEGRHILIAVARYRRPFTDRTCGAADGGHRPASDAGRRAPSERRGVMTPTAVCPAATRLRRGRASRMWRTGFLSFADQDRG